MNSKDLYRRANNLKRAYSHLLDTDKELAERAWDYSALLQNTAILMERIEYSPKLAELEQIAEGIAQDLDHREDMRDGIPF